MGDPFIIYAKLWELAEERGARVLYDGSMPDGEGWFHPDPYDSGRPFPLIRIGRSYPEEARGPKRERNASGRNKLPPPDLLYETITLAHECGHFLSWKDTPEEKYEAYTSALLVRHEAWKSIPEDDSIDAYWEKVRNAARGALDDEQVTLILEEEQRAWTIGHELLVSLGFEKLDLYAERERMGLHFHRYRMGIDPLWDEDLAARCQGRAPRPR